MSSVFYVVKSICKEFRTKLPLDNSLFFVHYNIMEDMPKSDTPKSLSFLDRVVSPIGIAVIVVVIILLSLGAYFYARRSPVSQQERVPTVTPTPTPTPRPIPHGKKGFTVGQSDKTVPQFSRGFIDPYDPEKEASQTVTIAVKYSQPVTKVTAVLKTDHAISTPVLFTLTSGTNTNGEWSASWRIGDTYLYTYRLVLNATSGTKTGSVEVTLR